jgi:uncharacterized protein YndB with AHSA1/START domain
VAWQGGFVSENEDSKVSVGQDPADGLFGVVVEQHLRATPEVVYRAWTQEIDTWFAAPGRVRMVPKEGEPFWFEVAFEEQRHPHHGRLMRLVPRQLIEMTWVTGRDGTWGAETLVRVELDASGKGTTVRLTHRGFYDELAATQHADAWPHVLEHLDDVLANE